MIVRDLSSSLHLFFVMQGSVVPSILGKIIGIALLSVVILLADQHATTLLHISISTMGVFGVALSLFRFCRNFYEWVQKVLTLDTIMQRVMRIAEMRIDHWFQIGAF